MKFLDFFAGCGGIRLGMEQAGHECVGFCELDKFAVASYTSMHLITDEQREYLATLPLKQRQKEILKEQYRNGEWYRDDITTVRADELPKADCWCFGFPCQDISVAGKQLGFQGNRSSLFFRVMHLLEQQREEEKPQWLFIENVKNLLSVNGGWDFARVLVEVAKAGYDAQWQVLNSKHFGVPQNRERVFIVCHLRSAGPTKIFPIEGTDGEDCVEIRQVGMYDKQDRDNPSAYRVYDPDGVSPTLNTSGGGGRQPMIKLKVLNKDVKHSFERVFDIDGGGPTLMSRDYKDPARIGIKVGVPLGVVHPKGKPLPVEPTETVPTLTSEHHGHKPEVVLPCLTPDRANKRQNGRRFKDSGEDMFTLTAQDIHGIGIGVDIPESDHPGMYVELEGGITAYAVWYEKEQCYIVVRRLTPREYARLMSIPDEYYEKMKFVNSDNQLYKQCGNSVVVDCVYEIARKIGENL